jgi:hypothetical protein
MERAASILLALEARDECQQNAGGTSEQSATSSL